MTASCNVYFSGLDGIGWINWDEQHPPNNLHSYMVQWRFYDSSSGSTTQIYIYTKLCYCFVSLIVMSGLWNRFRAILYTLTPISISVCSTQPQHGYTDFSQLDNNNYIFLYFCVPRHFRINATPLLRVAINKQGVYILCFY